MLRPVIVKDSGEAVRIGGRGELEASAAVTEALAGKSDVRQSGNRSAGSALTRLSSGDAVKDVGELIATFEGLQTESQLNPMELIRRMYLLTQLREGEVMDVLASLTKEEHENIGGPEFAAIAGMITLTRLAELNGPEAMRVIHSEEFSSKWDGAEALVAVTVMNSWVAADPEGAKRWFEDGMERLDQDEMKDLMENDDLRQSYYDGMAKHDAEVLARELDDESDPDKRDEVMVALVRNAKTSDELVGLLDRCAGASDARTEAVETLIKSDPAVAAAWVEKQAADDARDHDITEVASVMMERDSERGIEWYLAQEMAGNHREGDRLSRIVDHLASGDLEKAAEWVESRPDDAARDSAEASMAWQAKRQDWDEAMEWLTRVDDATKRHEALESMFRSEWNREEGGLPEHVIEAAEKAGMGDAARNYQPE